MNMKLLKNRPNYLVWAFLFPFLGMTGLMLVAGYNPFGDCSMLYSDMWHQYYPFFVSFRQALRSGDSLLYSWNIGMGIDYLGVVSYYLASPLNLLSVLLPDSWVLPYFGMLMPIKLGFAGLFFAIFLKKLFRKNDWSLPVFGCFYAMCAWALGYQWNVMWLDTFALLPLVALGTVCLLRDKKFVLYTVTLCLSVMTNYYIGFFTCIFVLLLFICYQICRCKKVLRLLQDFVRIGVFTVLAIGMTAILTLPALGALQTTQSSVNSYPEDFSLNLVDYSDEAYKEARTNWQVYKQAKEEGREGLTELWFTAVKSSVKPLLDGMSKAASNMNGGQEPTFKEGLPNLYCGVGTVFFAFLFLLARPVKWRDKICCVLLLLLFLVSFVVRQLDYIWHGFHFTNMIPYRFSFLYSFVMLYMAYRAFLLRNRLRLWQPLLAALLSIGIILLSDKLEDSVFLIYNGIFFLLYFGIMVFAKVEAPAPEEQDRKAMVRFMNDRKSRRTLTRAALLGVMCLELVLNLVNFGISFPYTSIPNYPKGTTAAASMIRYMQEDDDLFYRAEVTHAQTLNDGALNGYNGISAFTSSANVRVTEFMQHLGYSAKNTYNRYSYEEGSPVANLFLNLKYMIERDGNVEENNYFAVKHSYDGITLLENNAYLPLGFLAESELGELNFNAVGNQFTFQNELFRAATGLQANVWTSVPNDCLTLEPNQTQVTSQTGGGYCNYNNSGGATTYLTYNYAITQEGFLCMDMTMSARNEFYVYKNGKQLFTESLTLPQTFAICQVAPGDEIKVEVKCKGNEQGSVTVRPAVLDEAVFRQGYEILAASTLELTEFSNTRVQGTVVCNRDGLLYTSIPQDGNWVAYVDGEPAEITLVGGYTKQNAQDPGKTDEVDGVMIGLQLTAGAHVVRFEYRNDSFNLGLAVSVSCLAVFLGVCSWVYRDKLKAFAQKFKK